MEKSAYLELEIYYMIGLQNTDRLFFYCHQNWHTHQTGILLSLLIYVQYFLFFPHQMILNKCIFKKIKVSLLFYVQYFLFFFCCCCCCCCCLFVFPQMILNKCIFLKILDQESGSINVSRLIYGIYAHASKYSSCIFYKK